MSKKLVDNYIVKADDALNGIKDNDTISKTFVAYTAAFGTSIIQSGLIPALAFFCSKEEEGIERNKIVRAIAKMLGFADDKELLRKCIELHKSANSTELHELKQKIVSASIALKMMMRTYKLKDNDNGR